MRHILFLLLIGLMACQPKSGNKKFTGAEGEIKIITLAPGHFHAALLQKTMLKQLDKKVQVYAPAGPEVDAHLALINSFNNRTENPTCWDEEVYIGDDYLTKMLNEKKGNVVILAGNNKDKTSYILQSVAAGMNVLADKPMAIDKSSFHKLEEAFELANKKNVLLYDIMTERYDILNIVNRVLMQHKELFGDIQTGSPQDPAVKLESVHHFYKLVSGKPLVRPVWYYDVMQQGEGIVDVTTHLIDLIHWKCFPETILDYKKDIRITGAKHWATPLSLSDFSKSTLATEFPDYLNKDVKDSTLFVYANGEINYQVKDVNVGISVVWNFQAPEGSGDTHSSIIKGTKASIYILQGKEQGYSPKLYIKKADQVSETDFKLHLDHVITGLKKNYDIGALLADNGMYEIVISDKHKDGHEAHFSHVAEKFFGFLVSREMPEWEVPNMLTKYFITTEALEIAKKEDK